MPRARVLEHLPSLGLAASVAKNEEMQRFVEQMGFRNRFFWFDDFNQDDTVLQTNYWTTASTAGGDEVAFASQVGTTGTGAAEANTGATTGQAVNLIGPAIYKGDKNVGCWWRFKIDDVTAVEWEVGFVQGVIGSTASAVTDVDTPTVAMTDGAVVHCNTGQTLTTPAFVTEGSTANQGIKATSLSAVTPVNNTYMEVLIQIQGDDAICQFQTAAASAPFISTALHNTRATGNTAGYIEGGTPIAPWAYISTLGNAARVMTIDAFAIWSDR